MEFEDTYLIIKKKYDEKKQELIRQEEKLKYITAELEKINEEFKKYNINVEEIPSYLETEGKRIKEELEQCLSILN